MQGSCSERWKVEVRELKVKDNTLVIEFTGIAEVLGALCFSKNVGEELNVNGKCLLMLEHATKLVSS